MDNFSYVAIALGISAVAFLACMVFYGLWYVTYRKRQAIDEDELFWNIDDAEIEPRKKLVRLRCVFILSAVLAVLTVVTAIVYYTADITVAEHETRESIVNTLADADVYVSTSQIRTDVNGDPLFPMIVNTNDQTLLLSMTDDGQIAVDPTASPVTPTDSQDKITNKSVSLTVSCVFLILSLLAMVLFIIVNAFATDSICDIRGAKSIRRRYLYIPAAIACALCAFNCALFVYGLEGELIGYKNAEAASIMSMEVHAYVSPEQVDINQSPGYLAIDGTKYVYEVDDGDVTLMRLES